MPKPGGAIEVRDNHPVRQPKDLLPGECLVKMYCTGVCHTGAIYLSDHYVSFILPKDLHVKKDDWPLSGITPLIGGHEGVGEVVAIGTHTQDSPVKIGDRVGIKWLAYSCLQCEQASHT